MSTERDERLQRIYERGDHLRRRRAGWLASGAGAALTAIVLAAAAPGMSGGDVSDQLATVGGPAAYADGVRPASTPRGDAEDGDDDRGSSDRMPDRQRPGTRKPDATGAGGSTTTTVKGDDASGAAEATTTTLEGCRNSTNPDCGPFYYDPPAPPNEPPQITIVASPAAPKIGEPVTFTVTVVDPDGSGVACETFDPDAEDAEPASKSGGEGVPTQSTCGGDGPQAGALTLARYGPWDPPEPTPSRHEVTFTATYTAPGQRTAVYEMTEVGRCEGDSPCPIRSKEIELTISQ